jgi:hypothetical protein
MPLFSNQFGRFSTDIFSGKLPLFPLSSLPPDGFVLETIQIQNDGIFCAF